MGSIAPQLIYLGLSVLGLGVILANHGKPREPHNFVATFIVTILVWTILWWGGFFDPLFGHG